MPDVGLIDVRVAPSTVIETLLLEPEGLLTVTLCVPSEALDPPAIANVAVSDVELVTVMALTVIPVERDTDTLVPVVVKFVPVRVTEVVVVPRRNVFGAIVASVGRDGLTTVNVTVLLIPPVLKVTLTVLADKVALEEITKVAVTVESFTTTRLLEVTPEPDTAIADAPVSPLPLRVMGTLVPRAPEFGAIAVRVGPMTVNV